MSKHKHNNPENTPNTDTDQAKVEDILDTESQNAETEAELNAEVSAEQALQQELDKTRAELEKEKKEYLFLMADFDNYRKRQLKERADLIKASFPSSTTLSAASRPPRTPRMPQPYARAWSSSTRSSSSTSPTTA